MKLWPLLLLVAAGALFWVARGPSASDAGYEPLTEQKVRDHSEAPTVLGRAAGAGEEVRRLSVDGMCCAGCAGTLYETLVSVPGVKLAAIDFETGTASAIVDADLETDDLVRALTMDKYVATPAE